MIPLRKLSRILLRRDGAGLSLPDARVRKAAFSSLAEAANKAAQILVTIISVPLIVGYLGAERFGLAMAMAGFAQWFLFDTGIAEGMKLRLIEAFACNDRQAAQAYVATGTVALLALTALIGVTWAISFPFVDWTGVFNVDANDVNLRACLLVVVSIMLIMIPLKNLREVYMADQRGYVFSSWTLLGTVTSLGGIWFATRTSGGISAVLAGMYVPVLLASVACCLYLFLKDMPWLVPALSRASMETWRKMWSDSVSLLFLGVGLIILGATDVFVVNHYLGGEEASVYSLSIRIFFYVQVIVSLLINPAWPAIGDALHRGEVRWARKASSILFVISFGFAIPMSTLLVVFGRPLIRVWSRGEVDTDQTLLLLLGAYILLRIWCAVYGILLRALGRVRFQGLATLAEAALHLILGIYLLQRLGLIGLAIGSIASITLTRAWALPLEYYFVFDRHRLFGVARRATGLLNQKALPQSNRKRIED